MRKTENKIREALNLTQVEMAMLLNISRSELALKESGLRELSVNGLITESKVMRFLTTESKNPEETEVIKSDKHKFITKELKQNESSQYINAGKIERMKKHYEAAVRLNQLTEFMLQLKEDRSNIHRSALESLKAKAVIELGKNAPQLQLKLELKQKVLEYEKELLDVLLKEK